MELVGGRSTTLRAAFVALLIVLGACSDDSDDVASTSSTTSSADATVAGDDAGDPDDENPDDDNTASSSTSTETTATTAGSSTTSTTTQPATTTTGAPTTQAPRTTTTAPPRPPPTTTTTTAPPPPPPTTTTTTAPPPPSGPQHGTRNTGCEQYMYNQINAARANIGRPSLAFDGGIQYIAVDWSDELARSQTLRHNPNYGSQIFAARAQAQTAAENVGRGYSNESLFNAFMNSPGHRQNIESTAFSHVTVGCVNDSGGQIWVTQNFWG